MRKSLLLVFIIPIFHSCMQYCNAGVDEEQTVPDSILNLVPYKDSVQYTFIENGTTTFNMSSARKTVRQCSWDDYGCSQMREYYINSTQLSSKEPIVNIDISEEFISSTDAAIHILVNNSVFDIYLVGCQITNEKTAQSVTINKVKYGDLYVIRNTETSHDVPFADSIYYHPRIGIVKIFKHDGNTYQPSKIPDIY